MGQSWERNKVMRITYRSFSCYANPRLHQLGWLGIDNLLALRCLDNLPFGLLKTTLRATLVARIVLLIFMCGVHSET